MPYLNMFSPWHSQSEQLSTDALKYPAAPDRHPSLRAFLKEQPFFGIKEPVRRLIYCYANGVTAVQADPQLADKILKSLDPDTHCLFAYMELLDEYFLEESNGDDLTDQKQYVRVWEQAHVRVLDGINELTEFRQVRSDFDSWCALTFCAGVVARQRNTTGARNVLLERRNRKVKVEEYIFSFVISHAQNQDWFDWEEPIQRFIAGCYPHGRLQRAIMPRLYAKIAEAYDPSEEINEELFKGSFYDAYVSASNHSSTINDLIEEVNGSPEDESPTEHAWLIRKHEIKPGDPEKALDQLWPEAMTSIFEKYPDIYPAMNSPTKWMQLWATLQAVMDAAVWAGLYVGWPEVFEEKGK